MRVAVFEQFKLLPLIPAIYLLFCTAFTMSEVEHYFFGSFSHLPFILSSFLLLPFVQMI